MISIIICSIRKELRAQVKENISATIGLEDYEVIVIENEITNYPIAKAYNIAAKQAKYPFLCFVHEDILFHTNNWGALLIKHFETTNARLIGMLGCTVKTKSPGSVYIYESHFNRQNQLQRYPGKKVVHCYENPLQEQVSEVCILDGLFIAATKKAWEETQFSEDYLKGFHGYDIDFSLKNAVLGKVVVVYDILLEHFSFGSFSKEWVKTQLLLTKKWNKQLPFSAGKLRVDDSNLAEERNMKEFLKILISTDYDKKVLLKFFIKFFISAPLHPLNFFFIRQIILGKKLDAKLKRLFTSTGGYTNHMNAALSKK